MTRLEKQWAWFFTFAGWTWKYHPNVEYFLRPTFRVSFQCGHVDCPRCHELDVFLQNVERVEDFGVTIWNLASARPPRNEFMAAGSPYDPPHAALFGARPSATTWEMVHGEGGGMECVEHWVLDWRGYWAMAGALAGTSIHPQRRKRCA